MDPIKRLLDLTQEVGWLAADPKHFPTRKFVSGVAEEMDRLMAQIKSDFKAGQCTRDDLIMLQTVLTETMNPAFNILNERLKQHIRDNVH